MEDFSLIVKAFHVPVMRDAVRAYSKTIQADSESTPAQKAVAADLEQRVTLLATAITTEQAAKEARRDYHCYVHKRHCEGDKPTENATVTARPI